VPKFSDFSLSYGPNVHTVTVTVLLRRAAGLSLYT